MPRARTQSGNASCAAVVIAFAHMIHATPASSIAGAANQAVGAIATPAVLTAMSSEPITDTWSRLKRPRRRGSWLAARIAPTPIEASSSV